MPEKQTTNKETSKNENFGSVNDTLNSAFQNNFNSSANNSVQNQYQNNRALGGQANVSTQNPWDPQAGFLTDAFSKAQGIFNGGASNVYGGDLLAGFNPDQIANFRKMVDYGNNSTIPQQSAAAGSALTGSGIGGVTGALQTLGSFRPSGSVDSNIAGATQYADNPMMSSMVDAAMRDARRNASENVLPGIAQNAAVTGNAQSSRRALAEGVVNRGLAEKAGDISANLRGNAYQQGLDLAQRGSEFNDTTGLNAATARGALGSSAVGQGIGALGQSQDQQGALFGMAGAGGQGLQQATQANLDNTRGKSEYGTDRLNSLLQNYFQTVGSGNYGGSTTSTGTNFNNGSQFGSGATSANGFDFGGSAGGSAGHASNSGFDNSNSTENTTTNKYASPWSIAGGLAGGFNSLFSGGGSGGGMNLLKLLMA
jgi:hypothetical protein